MKASELIKKLQDKVDEAGLDLDVFYSSHPYREEVTTTGIHERTGACLSQPGKSEPIILL